ncbi:MAG: nodulation protein NfeD [Anaerolineae bacterium]
MRARTAVLLYLLLAAALALPGESRAAGAFVLQLDAEGPVAPVMQGYIERGIRHAEENAAEAVVLRLNTPGGSLNVTEAIVKAIRATRVPVVVYVAPQGAMAASAGTLITLAGHAAAMAPETVIGAASPINLDGSDLDSTSEAKAQEVMAATARALAERRGAAAQALAAATVTEARAVSATEAHDAGLVDFIAASMDDLLAQLDGFSVVALDQEVTLHTAGLPLETLPLSPLEQVLQVLTDPTIVFTLLSLGLTLLVVEFSAPGGWVAGTLGFACVVLALYGLGVLPINWLGVAFIVLAVVLFIIEAQNPATTGILAVSAGVTLIIGALILFSRPELAPFGELSIPVVVAQAAILTGLFLFFISRGLIEKRNPPVTGAEAMVGQVAEARTDLDPAGTVFVAGERWAAVSKGGRIRAGGKVRVTAVDNLSLTVEPVEPTEPEDAPQAET